MGPDPNPARAGETFAAWVKALRRLGGKIETRELRGCDYGAPTIRKRLFIVIRFDKRKIVWPKPTHGAPNSPEVLSGKLLPWRSAVECIDWSLPCPSIFDTAHEIMAKHGLRAIRPLKPNTLARIARGMARYVLGAERPFIVNTASSCQAIPTIVDCGGRAGQSRPRGGNEPFATVTAKADACMVAASITRFNGGATGADLRDPMPTITANSWIKKPGGAMPLGILAPYLASIAHGDSGGRREYPLADPVGTVTVGGIQHALVAPVLTYAQQGGASRSITDPHHTICASRKDQNGLFAAALVQTGYGEREGQAPRALDMSAQLGTVVAGGVKHAPFAAFLAQHNGGPRMGAHAGHNAASPMSTIAASGSQQTPVAAFLARHFGSSTGHDASEPSGTVTAGGGGKSGLVSAFFAKYYGTGDGSETCEPLHTITTKDRMGHVQADLAAPPFSPEHHARARAVADFLREYGAWDGGEYVTLTLGGAEFVVIDIGMRMLTPRELFNAQGFPSDYVIEGVWDGLDSETPKFRAFPGHVQVSCCGNSVCPPVAAALVRANCGHLAEIERAEQ